MKGLQKACKKLAEFLVKSEFSVALLRIDIAVQSDHLANIVPALKNQGIYVLIKQLNVKAFFDVRMHVGLPETGAPIADLVLSCKLEEEWSVILHDALLPETLRESDEAKAKGLTELGQYLSKIADEFETVVPAEE